MRDATWIRGCAGARTARAAMRKKDIVGVSARIEQGRIESTMDGVAGQEAAMSIAHSLAVVSAWPERLDKQFMTIT
jgi:hypothetical protein